MGMIKKHLEEIKTFDDFLKFLRELSAMPDGTIFYLPIYLKFEELYYKQKEETSLAFGLGFLIGSIITYVIVTLMRMWA